MGVTSETDHELALDAAAGNRMSFTTLVERHYDRIYRLAWRWTGSREMAEDAAQDVCVKLATAIRLFRGEAQFATWLYRLAYTVTIDLMRANQRLQVMAPSNVVMLVDGTGGPTPEDEVVGKELWQAVRMLPEQQRDAVLLVYAEDLSHGEAATIMGCSEKTVSWHLHEARKRLKAKLETAG